MLKNKTLKKILSYILILSVTSSLCFPMIASNADTLSQLREKLKAAQEQKEKAEKQLSSVKSDISDAKAQRQELDREIAAVESEVHEMSNKIAENEARIAEKEKELIKAEEDAEKYEALFKSRARIMYERGEMTYVDIIFGARSFSDLLSRIEMITQIIDYDKAVLQELIDLKDAIAKAKQELETVHEELLVNNEILKAKKSELDAKKASMQSVIAKLESDEEAYKKILDEADRIEAQLKSEISSIGSNSATSTYSGGIFAWPTPSTSSITSPYGNRYHPIQKRVKFHSGIDIGAGYGASIVAAEAGTVLRSGWNGGGYGNYIVIDHGGGVQTLYGHCSVRLVSAGDTVTKGQVIGKVGSTGNSTGPHLHFEVLINGSPTDPMAYFG